MGARIQRRSENKEIIRLPRKIKSDKQKGENISPTIMITVSLGLFKRSNEDPKITKKEEPLDINERQSYHLALINAKLIRNKAKRVLRQKKLLPL